MSKRIVLILPITLIAIVALVFGSCSRGEDPGTVRQLTIGSSNNEADTLIYIADEQGFFAANGLDVTIKNYSSGSAAVDGMLNGEVDLATSSEYVIVQRAFKKRDVRTIGVISRSGMTQLAGRTDRGIRSVTDLEGKKVGLPVGTLAQFQFGRFTDLRGMHDRPMTLVDIAVDRSVDAIVNGEVDAVVSWEPYLSRIKEKLGDKVVVWPAQNEQPQLKNLTGTGVWLEQHPDLAQRVMKSLAQAEKFVSLYSDQARTMVQERLQYDDGYMALVWPSNQFSLALDQSLLIAMEDEARWMIASNLATDTQIPDFAEYIYPDGLKAVKPEAVNIR